MSIIFVVGASVSYTQDAQKHVNANANSLKAPKIENALGMKGTTKDGKFKVTVAHNEAAERLLNGLHAALDQTLRTVKEVLCVTPAR